MYLKSGIVHFAQYEELLRDPVFLKMEKYVHAFLQEHGASLEAYRKQWIADPFHQWSRQWEYPYVFQEIEDYVHNCSSDEIRILDAGSGVTFFPGFITHEHCQARVACCDADRSYPPMFKEIYMHNPHVAFQVEDLRRLSYADQQFDVVYCISVLEHTRNYAQILNEFHRVLKKNGRLILTFDVALEPSADIPLEEAEALLQALKEFFTPYADLPPIGEHLNDTAVTTLAMAKTHPEWLPWKYPFLSHVKSALKRKQWPKRRLKPLTFYCGSFIKN